MNKTETIVVAPAAIEAMTKDAAPIIVFYRLANGDIAVESFAMPDARVLSSIEAFRDSYAQLVEQLTAAEGTAH